MIGSDKLLLACIGGELEAMLADKFEAILDTSGGEVAAHAFLKKYPSLVLWAVVRTGGHSKYVLTEFPIGIKYRADFVVPFSYSWGWDVYCIELESVKDQVITKSGRPSKRLNTAISQVGDWEEYIEQYCGQVKKDLSDWCIKHDLLNFHAKDGLPCNYTNNYLKDSDTYVNFHYYIFIGRRDTVTPEKRSKMNQYRRRRIEIYTYDRFLDIARNLDYHNAHPDESVYLPGTHE